MLHSRNRCADALSAPQASPFLCHATLPQIVNPLLSFHHPHHPHPSGPCPRHIIPHHPSIRRLPRHSPSPSSIRPLPRHSPSPSSIRPLPRHSHHPHPSGTCHVIPHQPHPSGPCHVIPITPIHPAPAMSFPINLIHPAPATSFPSPPSRHSRESGNLAARARHAPIETPTPRSSAHYAPPIPTRRRDTRQIEPHSH